MGVPVKISDDLVAAARQVAKPAKRSLTKQIENWAELGWAVEHLVPMSGLVALKTYLADPTDTANAAAARAALQRPATALADDSDRTAAVAAIHSTGRPVYGSVSGREDRVQQVWPDGRRVVGRVVDREFVADGPVAD